MLSRVCTHVRYLHPTLGICTWGHAWSSCYRMRIIHKYAQHEISFRTISKCHKMPIYQFHLYSYKYKNHITQTGIYSSQMMINIQTTLLSLFWSKSSQLLGGYSLCKISNFSSSTSTFGVIIKEIIFIPITRKSKKMSGEKALKWEFDFWHLPMCFSFQFSFWLKEEVKALKDYVFIYIQIQSHILSHWEHRLWT